MALQEYPKAASSFENAVKIDSDRVDNHRQLGNAYAQVYTVTRDPQALKKCESAYQHYLRAAPSSNDTEQVEQQLTLLRTLATQTAEQ